MSELNKKLFRNYHEIHSIHLDESDEIQQKRVNARAEANYLKFLPIEKNARILEIGCNKGYFLSWLESIGYTNLVGVDLSVGDIQQAEQYLKDKKNIRVMCADAIEFLHGVENNYDMIIFRAVFEHIEKQQSEFFLQTVGKALKSSGIVLIEVPNMDWFLSNHERYMDFTHEVGFTRESLRQLLSLYYKSAEVYPVKEGYFSFAGMIRTKILKPLCRVAVQFFLSIMGEGASNILWSNRHILAHCSKFQQSS